MKVASSYILDAEISVSRNAKSADYQINDHELYENKYLPINLNNLKFIERNKNERLVKALYQDPDTGHPSGELRMNLMYFYVFIILYFTSLAGFAALLNTEGDLSSSHLKIHLTCLVTLTVFSLWILYSLFKWKKHLLNSRNWFFVISCSINFYLILADERILYKLTGEVYNDNRLPLSLGLICVIVMSRIVLFDYYLYVLILGLSTTLLFLITNLSLSEYSVYYTLSEAFIIGLFACIQIIECYRTDIRTRQIFWRREQEFMNEAQRESNKKAYAVPGINTEAEGVLEKCDTVAMHLKNTSRVVIYKDVKKILKICLSDIEKIKRKVAHGGFEVSKIELSPAIDDEDRAFIFENFMEVSSVRGSTSRLTVTEINEKLTLFPFSRYGVAELESVLSSLGKNWSFDIWFVYESTGHSISMVSKYLFQKWNINDSSGIPEEVCNKYFQELEAVRLM
jgi:hypothetical protein